MVTSASPGSISCLAVVAVDVSDCDATPLLDSKKNCDTLLWESQRYCGRREDTMSGRARWR